MLVRWDNVKIQLVIDNQIIINKTNYKEFWPKKYNDHILFGTWQNRWAKFYCNTNFFRIQVLRIFPSNKWIIKELEFKPNNYNQRTR